MNKATEKHPLEPFLPQNARILMLGSFPPPQAKWSMRFFYPNWINDMWRIMGLIFYNDKHHFEIKGKKRFNKDAIIDFCLDKGIALYDTACEVKRLKDNASDKFLEVITPTDIKALLAATHHCTAIVTTGQKATDTIVSTLGCAEPPVGGMTTATIGNRELRIWRMPSSSRAYPLALEKKAMHYRAMLDNEGIA
jgi:G:T/U-mismatch repair DNA glycosylase